VPRPTVVYLQPPLEFPLDPSDLPSTLELVTVVTATERSGLARALAHISPGEAETLFVPRLSTIAGSLGELVGLFDWLDAAGAHLVAADMRLDTATGAGRRSVALVREIERWGREPDDSRRARGRPGLRAGSPLVAERIAHMRESGMSMGAIAAALNAEGVPTPRGGAEWRPSSVQAALGYRRPRPPAPGAPRPRPGGGSPPPGRSGEEPGPRGGRGQ
jgi:Resolvase, N terminal domain/Recombinase